MASPAEGYTRLQKVAIFLIVLGVDKAREVLADLDLATVEQINATMVALGPIAPEVKAAVMIEFSDFFYHDKPLTAKLKPKPGHEKKPAAAPKAGKKSGAKPPPPAPAPAAEEEENIQSTLRKLRERVDPGSIDWSRAGYDFGEGFKGPAGGRR